ncbi:MAG: dihydropteroate synthase [Acidaminobacteraceae bacterium]
MKNFVEKKYNNYEVDLRGHKIEIGSKTYIMGILNVTPDSFSDGGKFIDMDIAVKHAKQMLVDGADIIDIGGESTRPGAAKVLAEEEIIRVIPIVERLVREVDAPISVDTYKAKVAEEALKVGAHMINDVWGLQKDLEIANVIAKYDAPVCIMHNQEGTEYKEDIIVSMKKFFEKSLQIAKEAGIKDKNIILDPGIGFGKTVKQNIHVMSRLHELNSLGYPVLLGTSRKSMIGKILDLPSDERVEGTLSTSVIGIMQGCEIVRVHDIKENLRAIKVADAIVRGE